MYRPEWVRRARQAVLSVLHDGRRTAYLAEQPALRTRSRRRRRPAPRLTLVRAGGPATQGGGHERQRAAVAAGAGRGQLPIFMIPAGESDGSAETSTDPELRRIVRVCGP